MKKKLRPRDTGFSLVICLIVLTLLSILVVSFFATSTLERSTAKAFGNKATAQSAAETAANQAMSLLAEKIAQYPDSATVWEKVSNTAAPGAATAPPGFEGTMLYQSDGPNKANGAVTVFPLVSRGVDTNGVLLGDVKLANKATAFSDWTEDNTINLNRPRFNGDKAGWIGTAPPKPGTVAAASPTPIPFRAKWVEVKDKPATDKTARTIARYAFWIEDESFKLNLNQLGATKRGLEKVSPGTVPFEIPYQGLLRSANAPTTVNRDAFATNVLTLRNGFYNKALLDLRSYNEVDTTYNLGDEAKFLGTIYSGALNVSRHGSQRVNLNAVMGMSAANFDPAKYNPSTAEVQKQVDQIAETIRYHTLNDTTKVQKFGQRFYRTTVDKNADQVSASHVDIYLYKLAANIRDYMDPDLQPTILLKPVPGQTRPAVMPKIEPLSAINADAEGTTDIWAQGKESGVYLQEAAVRYRTVVSGGKYQLQVDYYIEFWNMGSKDVYTVAQPGITEPHVIGPNAFLRISNQQGWLSSPSGLPLQTDASNTPLGDPIQNPARDLVIDLTKNVAKSGTAVSGVCFKAGQCTVITTDPNYTSVPASGGSSPAFSGGYNATNIYYCSSLLNATRTGPGKRFYTGPLRQKSDTGVKPDFRDGTQDYDTEVILGTSSGVVDSLPAAIAMGGSAQITTSAARDDWYGGTLLGNGTTPSQLGDPRTNNEQMVYHRFTSGASTAEPDQSRYWNTVGSPRFSLGYPNDLYVNPQNTNAWPDYYKGWVQTSTNTAINPTAATAPAYVADAKLTSIGQLGDIFDPARVPGNKGTAGIEGSRGGGRTLRIGQKDDLVDMTKLYTPSQQWAAWRLADFFSTSGELYQPGLININGLMRDNGAALRAACYGLILNVVSQNAGAATATVASRTLDSDEYGTGAPAGLQRLINQAIVRLTGTNTAAPTYFRERGEISQLDLFSAGTDLTGVSMNDTFDRSREELVRRLLDLITTRGNIFSVYTVGQAVAEGKDAKKTQHVTGEHWMKTTFALLPKKADGSDFKVTGETFDPTTASARTTRFAKPDHYDIQLIQVSSP